jgi:hypothetical protein
MTKLLFSIVLAIPATAIAETSVAGDWTGILNFPRQQLHIVLHIAGPDNNLSATEDSPDQDGYGRRVDSIMFSGSTLRFSIQQARINFSGSKGASDAITGVFNQNGVDMPLTLTRTVSPSTGAKAGWVLGVVEGGRYRHLRTGTEFDLPTGWSVQSTERAAITNQPSAEQGELARLANPEFPSVFAAVWMVKTNTFDIPQALKSAIVGRIAQRRGPQPGIGTFVDYDIQPGSVQQLWIGGAQAQKATSDYQQRGQELSEVLTWIYTARAKVLFFALVPRSDAAAFEARFDELVKTAMVP